MKKFCPSCEVQKPLTAFTVRKSGRVGQAVAHCTACRVAKQKSDRQADPERFMAIERKSKFKRQYGISLEQYAEMLDNQGGGCAICGTTKPSERTTYFAVDHCHSTGKVRGLLCTKCNRGLGLFNDEPERLKAAAKYLIGG